jgi:aryl-alcohol dehydrogenase-like predicted oxidoreductase
LSWSSQAGGFFTGRFSPEIKEDKDMVRVYYSDLNWERYNRAQKLASKKGCNPIQIALAYVLNQKFPTAGIIGPRTVDELRSSYQALQIKLSQDEVSWLHLEEEFESMID